MLEVRGISKNFGRTVALDAVSFDADVGVCSLVGPNGAGKSTLLRTLAGVMRPLGGTAVMDGVDIFDNPFAVHAKMSYLSDRVPLYNDLTIEEHLIYRGRLRALSGVRLRARVRKVISAFDLGEISRVRISRLSAGQRKRTGLADAFLTDCKLYLIDEPYAGLDEAHASLLSDYVRCVAQHSTVMMATHDFELASSCGGKFLVLREGRLLGEVPAGTPRPPREVYGEMLAEAARKDEGR